MSVHGFTEKVMVQTLSFARKSDEKALVLAVYAGFNLDSVLENECLGNLLEPISLLL